MVEIFKTNVHKEEQAQSLLSALSQTFPLFRINFDLEDCDKVLRVEGQHILPGKIIEVLGSKGYYCSVLE